MLPRNIFRRIAPVGNPIALTTTDRAFSELSDDSRVRLVQSGTAALAAAVAVAKTAKQECDKPEVIIPAYCCPDIVAAIVYNDCIPVMVDFIADRTYMDIDAIVASITTNTIAVIAVNFLGIPERCKQIRSAIEQYSVLLIEDSAQWFPERGNLFDSFEGDLVVLSFGKGKPVSLLGGGAMISRNAALSFSHLQIAPPLTQSPVWRLRLLFAIYNLLIHPLFHWLLELLPFVEMGVTRYKPLTTVAAIDKGKLAFLAANIERYRQRRVDAPTMISDDHCVDLPTVSETYRGQRLLRYPLLMPSDHSARAVIMCSKLKGCGLSPLYQNTLDVIDVVNRLVSPRTSTMSASALTISKSFAHRLVTLPTHTHAKKNNNCCIIQELQHQR